MWGTSSDEEAEALGASKAGAQATTDMWYNGELPHWPASDYGNDSPDMTNFESWGHFSQVVWKNSQQLGCATQFCAKGTMDPNWAAWYTVCNYYPAGRFLSFQRATFSC